MDHILDLSPMREPDTLDELMALATDSVQSTEASNSPTSVDAPPPTVSQNEPDQNQHQQVASPLCSSTSVWHGLFVWGNEYSFECECEAVSGGLAVSKAGREMSEIGSGDGGKGGRIDLIGLSDSRVVWDYVKQLRDSWDRMVCLLVINLPKEVEDFLNYMNCFDFCNKENQLGVLDFADHPTIKDGYVFTLSPGEPLPSALLALDGVALPDWTKRNRCIMLVIVRRMDLEDKQSKRQQVGIDTSGTPPTKKPRVSAVSSSISKKIELLCCVHAVLVYAQNLKNDIVKANERECAGHIRLLIVFRQWLACLYRLGINSPQTIGTSQQVASPLCSSTSVWHGLFVWGNECSFECECEAVSGGLAVSKAGREMSEIGSGDGGKGGRIDLIGLSDSRVVWDYVKQLRDSWDRMVCLLVIKKPEGGQNLDKYTDCFAFCDKKNQLGVLDFADHPTIKDGYVFTLSPGEPLPSALLALDGVALPDWTKRNRCIMLVIVRQMDLEDKKSKRQQMGIDTSGTPPTKKPRVSAVSSSISKKIELLCCVHAVLVYAQNLKNDIVKANERECDGHIEHLLIVRRQLARLYRLGRNSPQTIGTSQLAAIVEETVED